MIDIKRLAEIADSKQAEDNKKYAEIKAEIELKKNEMFYSITDGLEAKLIELAKQGRREYTVLETKHGISSIDLNFNNLYSKGVPSNKSMHSLIKDGDITIDEVIKNALPDGLFKRVYDWCIKNNLNPIVKYWDDGVGMYDGFGIYLKW